MRLGVQRILDDYEYWVRNPAELKTELEKTKLRPLHDRAVELGVDNADLAAATDEGKPAVIALILDAERLKEVCPNPAEQLDRWLSHSKTGEPTLLFRAAQLSERRCVVCRGLRKVYDSTTAGAAPRVAVAGLDLELFESHITVLLGEGVTRRE